MSDKNDITALSDDEIVALFERIKALVPALSTKERLEVTGEIARALLYRVDKLETKIKALAAERDTLRSLIGKSGVEVTTALLIKTGDAQLRAETAAQRVEDIPHAEIARVCEFVALHARPDKATELAMGAIHEWLMNEATAHGVAWRKHDTRKG